MYYTIQYIDNTNLAYCDNYKFRKDKRGYWISGTLHKYLHQYIYEKYKGNIPKGYEVHHIDHNKDNNEIENLKLVTKQEHLEIHKKEMTEELKQKLRNNVINNAMPKAKEWHKSLNGKEWHKEHYEKMKEKLYILKDFKCEQCGKEFQSTKAGSRFCSNNCKSKWRRLNHLDDEERICIICNKKFFTNKYNKNVTCSKKCGALYRKTKGYN